MTVYCSVCGHEAVFRDTDEHMSPFMENGYYECGNHECTNSCVTDGTHEGNRMNRFRED